MRHSLTDYSTDTRVLLVIRLNVTPPWRIRDRKRTALALERAKLRRECLANDAAHRLRADGHHCPVGTILFGERVTR